MKPFMGELNNWWRDYSFNGVSFNKDNLGFFVRGQFNGHPQFHGQYGYTSMVVRIEFDRDGNGSIETLNSTYKLVGPEAQEDPKVTL